MAACDINGFCWAGSQQHFLDHPDVTEHEGILIGRYGGNTAAGGKKNEDGCLVWRSEKKDWEFVMILDGHNSAESVELVLCTFQFGKSKIIEALSQPIGKSFGILEGKILDIFQSPSFLKACRTVKGETNCLITVRKEKYLWWFSIGDNLLYLFHEELAAFGQYQLTQRSFYEWVGYVNTFNLEVPCYSTGRKELRKGQNCILLSTDGLVECPNEPYVQPESIKAAFSRSASAREGIQELLNTVHENQGTDSATMLVWTVEAAEDGTYASDQFKSKEADSKGV